MMVTLVHKVHGVPAIPDFSLATAWDIVSMSKITSCFQNGCSSSSDHIHVLGIRKEEKLKRMKRIEDITPVVF